MDSKTRIKNYISSNFPNWEKVDYAEFGEEIDFKKDFSELYRINDEEVILVSYTNISITGTERPKPQLRVFLDEYKKPFYFAKRHQLRYYLFSIFTKEDEMARGLDNFNPKEYIISIETNLDKEDARRDLRSIFDYANEHINGRKFLKCSRSNYKADINQASFIYIGSIENPDVSIFESFVNIFDSRPYLDSKYEEAPISSVSSTDPTTSRNYDKYLRALRTKPFMLLAGISGTGKSRIVRELAFKSCPEYLQDKTTPGNYLMVEVKPNWHDSSELLGYYSNITKQYQFTRFVKFLVKAKLNPQVPFFVCLDEMNLAPVEQYFAEFLSILETRKKSGDNIQTGVLIEGKNFVKTTEMKDENDNIIVSGERSMTDGKLYTEFFGENMSEKEKEIAAAHTDFSIIKDGLTLPDNVFVIGTVNMDDTTHQFSRKVIDRAMTIEMNGGKLSDMFGHSSDLEYLPQNQVWSLDLFKPKYVNADEVVANKPDATQIITEELPKQLDAINDALRDTPFQVSYRVLNEMVIYFSVLLESGMSSEDAKNLAVDQMLLMKILPRIEGDRDMLMLDAQTCRLDKLEPFAVSEDTKKKIAEMKNRLNKQEFTRFWP